MKKLILLILIAISLSSFNIPLKVNDFNIVGKWTGFDEEKEKGSFVFDSEGYATMIKDNQMMGGKEFVMNGMKACMKYKIDESSTPIKFDLIIFNLKTKESKNMKMLLKIVDNNTIKLASNFNETRPNSFNKENTILLKRE